MNQFDEAVARARAELPAQRAQASAQQGLDRSHAEDAARLEPELRRLVIQFAQYLAAGTPPRAYRLPFRGMLSRKSPKGILLNADVRTVSPTLTQLVSFTLVTEDGRIWSTDRGYLDLSAAALTRGLSWPLGFGATLVVHEGQLKHQHVEGDRSSYTHSYTLVHEDLAKRAVYLGEHPVALKYPECFK